MRLCGSVAILGLLLNLTGGARADNVTVNVGDGGLIFVPSDPVINPGDTVTFVWITDNHSVTSDDPNWPIDDTGVQVAGFQVDATFLDAGDYSFYCTPHHCFGMTGVVHVVPAQSARAYVKPIGVTGGVLAVGVLSLLGYGWWRRKT
jgi:plastocyanin